MKSNNLNYIKLHNIINNQEKNIIIYYNNLEKIDDNYFIDLIKSNENYSDFFFEIDKDEDNTFLKNNKNKYSNIRLHWNNVLSNNFIIKSISYEIYNYIIFYINIIKNSVNEKNYNLLLFNNFLNNIYQVKNNIIIFIDILNNNYNNKDNHKNNIYSYTFYFINKIKNKYNQNYFIIINQYIIIIIKYIDYIINKTRKYIEKNNNKLNQLIFNLINKLTKIYNILYIINNIFNDMYTMRRILDKNYISNCVIYSKSNILINYIFSLVNLFKFKIIEISPSNFNIDDINQKINNINFDIKYQHNTSKLLN